MDRAALWDLHPFFRLPEVEIHWCDGVQKVGLRNELEPGILVVASFGVLLIHRKSFGSSFGISASISFCDLISLDVAGPIASFGSKQIPICVKHLKVAEVAFLVYFIRQAQLPTDDQGPAPAYAVLPCVDLPRPIPFVRFPLQSGRDAVSIGAGGRAAWEGF
jgi:hypothetical protein